MMVMVMALADGADGAAGDPEPPYPPPPQDNVPRTTADAAARTNRRRIRSPVLPLVIVRLSKSHTRDFSLIVRGSRGARYSARKRFTASVREGVEQCVDAEGVTGHRHRREVSRILRLALERVAE